MKRLASLSAALAIFATASVLGAAMPPAPHFDRLELGDGTILHDATIMSYSPSRGRVIVAEGRSLRTLPFEQLPPEAREKVVSRHRARETDRVRVAPDRVVTTVRPAPAVSTPPAVTDSREALLRSRATDETGDELRFYLLDRHPGISAVDCKVRTIEEVPGWSQLRVKGVAAYSVWDPFRRDYRWSSGKFELIFNVKDGDALEADAVTFDGISQAIDS